MKRTQEITRVFAVLAMVAGFGASAALAQNGYSYGRPIVISHAAVANSDQVDFPVLISGSFPYLATVANSGQVLNPSGYDIAFSADAAGQNPLGLRD